MRSVFFRFACLEVTLISLLAPLSASAQTVPEKAPAATMAAPDPATPPLFGWKLVWSDEFNYSGLPDKNKWGYEEGYVRNGEKQYYTRERRENVRVENGMLVIEGRKDSFDLANKPRANGKTVAEYTAASLITKGKASWQYGRIEVRAKLPDGKGVWPAIWMMGDNISTVGWPKCGEIDIMEYVGKDPNIHLATLHWFGLDWKTKKPGHEQKYVKLTVPRLCDDFHVFALEWTPEKMDITCDGKLAQSFPVSKAESSTGNGNPFRNPQFLILNLALGGGMAGPIDPGLAFPKKFLIDYVRVYQRASY